MKLEDATLYDLFNMHPERITILTRFMDAVSSVKTDCERISESLDNVADDIGDIRKNLENRGDEIESHTDDLEELVTRLEFIQSIIMTPEQEQEFKKAKAGGER